MSGEWLLHVLIDLDHTLWDKQRSGVESARAEALGRLRGGMSEEQAVRSYELLRSRSALLEWFGVASPNHEPGSARTLAVWMVWAGADSESRRGGLGERLRAWAEQAAEIERSGGRHWAERRRALMRAVQADGAWARLVARVGELAEDERVRAASAAYEGRVVYRLAEGAEAFLDSWSRRAGTSVWIVSEGLEAVQQEKLSRLGLAERWSGRLLTTGLAAWPAGAEKLWDRPDEESADVWRSVLHLWSEKTAWFFGRVLHALQAGGERARESLVDVEVAGAQVWRERPMRFVMIGDRYDKDIEPLVMLLGAGVGHKVRLRRGRYAEQAAPAEATARPDAEFVDWAQVDAHLRALRPEMLEGVDVMPRIVPEGFVSAGELEAGRRSALAVVRRMAEAVAAVERGRAQS